LVTHGYQTNPFMMRSALYSSFPLRSSVHHTNLSFYAANLYVPEVLAYPILILRSNIYKTTSVKAL